MCLLDEDLCNENVFPKEINDILENNNVLLMTNLSTDFYIKTLYNKEKCLVKKEVSNISKESILSSFVLYNILKINNRKLIKFYVTVLLSFIKYNKKEIDFKLLSTSTTCFNKDEFNSILKYKKIKIEGNHYNFSLNPIRFRNIFFYKTQNVNYYKNYQDFLDITLYNN